jgi:hypothetical protein
MKNGEFYAVTCHNEEGAFCFASGLEEDGICLKTDENGESYEHMTYWISSGSPCGDLFSVEEQAQYLADDLNRNFPNRNFVVRRFTYNEVSIVS